MSVVRLRPGRTAQAKEADRRGRDGDGVDALATALGDAACHGLPRQGSEIVGAIIRLAHVLGLDVVAEGVYGLCSGLMDGVGGQVITIDRGAGLFENYSRLYDLQRAP